MATKPRLADYINLIMPLFGLFEQPRAENGKRKRGRPYTYPEARFIVFLMLMQFRQRHRFKAQQRWSNYWAGHKYRTARP